MLNVFSHLSQASKEGRVRLSSFQLKKKKFSEIYISDAPPVLE